MTEASCGCLGPTVLLLKRAGTGDDSKAMGLQVKYKIVEVWSVAVYYNEKFCTQRSRPRSIFSCLQAFVVQTLFLDLKQLVK